MNAFQKQFRYALKFKKIKPLHFIGHLDLLRFWEKVLRRSNLPVVYTQGFNPHLKMSLAQPLPLGVESEGEYLEFYLNRWLNPQKILEITNNYLPEGLKATQILLLPPGKTSLTSQTALIVYEAEFLEKPELIKDNIDKFLTGAKPVKISLMRRGEDREFPLQPEDYSFEVLDAAGNEMTNVILKIKYRQAVPLHAPKILKAVAGLCPETVRRKEIIFALQK